MLANTAEYVPAIRGLFALASFDVRREVVLASAAHDEGEQSELPSSSASSDGFITDD